MPLLVKSGDHLYITTHSHPLPFVPTKGEHRTRRPARTALEGYEEAGLIRRRKLQKNYADKVISVWDEPKVIVNKLV